MPQIFKALATTSVWALWIGTWVILLSTLVMGILKGHLFAPGAGAPPLYYPINFGLAFLGGILSICGMKLRQMLE